MEDNQNLNQIESASETKEVIVETNTAPKPKYMAPIELDQKPKKKNKGMVFGMVFLALLAIGGIGFGVWALLDKNQSTETLNSQISTLKTQNTDLLDQLSNEAENDTIINIDTNSATNTIDYIYVGEWGLKIKIPNNLEFVSYQFARGNNYTNVSVAGAKKDGGQYFPNFADKTVNHGWLGTVSRYTKGTMMPLASPPQLVFSDDNYDYYYAHPQAPIGNEVESDWEVQTVEVIEDMLTNPDNYSSI